MISGARTIGLALSGGGSRAAAFHLGCLRALHDLDLLDRVRVVSGISGGSLLAALWAYGPKEFSDFDAATTELLRRGLHRDIALRAFWPPTTVARNLMSATRAGILTASRPLGAQPRALRRSHRTDALIGTLRDRAFADLKLADVTHAGLDVVLTACDLNTGKAVRFGSVCSSCTAHGTIVSPVTVAEAVGASAAFPVLLPALQRSFLFERNGRREQRDVLLTDGGIYDNLGISVLDPTRSVGFTPHIYNVKYIVACDAGVGDPKPHIAQFWPARMKRSFEITHRRAQDGGRAHLHQTRAAGHIDGFVHAYLGMADRRLPVPVRDLVAQPHVATYPTNFASMSQENLRLISTRGEQLIRTLLPHYCPDLVRV
ncbi:patatin-like phospholipase family protein [Catellatospora chokoriensis]|uniref:PNPLA domain-containing protein n=1 Tax=Catellatospora chokoriensis TaxID=310353 RepID=A0A8J3K351_9ACTN|nr:patatin-like phospholipase family protein [Catellatospora chokoriensis]GIF89850.1 hypothetical protein Cch02nite_32940 [Catellatospora chokoriensis]